MPGQTRKQTEDLAACYPGRGRTAPLWLIVVPGLLFAVLTAWFGKFATVTSDGIRDFASFTKTGRRAPPVPV